MRFTDSASIYKDREREKKQMDEVNEVIIKRRPERQPMSFERLRFLCYFAAGIVAEILGFALAAVIVLCMAGVLT